MRKGELHTSDAVAEKCPYCMTMIVFDKVPNAAGSYHRNVKCDHCDTKWKVTIHRSIAGKPRFDWTFA